MASTMLPLFLVSLSIILSLETTEAQYKDRRWSFGWIDPTKAKPRGLQIVSKLALAVARSTYLPTDRFVQNGTIKENPSHFGKHWIRCPQNKPEMQAGLCYKPCNMSEWAFVKGVGPLCLGCPKSHPVVQGALCYKRCPSRKPKGRMGFCFGACPSGYRNGLLTCYRNPHLRVANISGCPWYDKCGLIFSRGCSKCPAGYKNDGCTCRQNPHVTSRPRYYRGIGILMKTYSRGVGALPKFFRYDPTGERDACKMRDWVGTAFVNKDAEVVKLVSHSQHIVVFGFRGTEIKSISDWLVNLDVSPVEFVVNDTRLKAHGGFKRRYDQIAVWFEREYANIPKNYTIFLTGHNQGGAQASIAAVFAAGKLSRPPNAVITWGSPLTGAESFRKFYKKYVGCKDTVNYVTKGDIVARSPVVFGYAHACDVVELAPKFSDFIRSHSLYSGYGEGLERKYGKNVFYGCDVHILTRAINVALYFMKIHPKMLLTAFQRHG